jgi:hypothetical protein
MTWLGAIFAVIGAINIYVSIGLARSFKKRDEHECSHKGIERRLTKLEDNRLTEERFRQILVDELGAFELRLINDGRLDPKTKRRNEK